MVSFQHPNVMSLVGMCFDGDIPLIIMPYMSEGSVLRYVKENKRALLFDKEVNEDSAEVCIISYYIYFGQSLRASVITFLIIDLHEWCRKLPYRNIFSTCVIHT